MLAHSTLHQCDIVTSKVTLMYLSWHCERCEMASIGLKLDTRKLSLKMITCL